VSTAQSRIARQLGLGAADGDHTMSRSRSYIEVLNITTKPLLLHVRVFRSSAGVSNVPPGSSTGQ
jgi:hypothetical protein